MVSNSFDIQEGHRYLLQRLDYNRQITRTDYKPLNIANGMDPFDGKTGFVTQINDFATGKLKIIQNNSINENLLFIQGLSYTINMDLGNCTIDYLTNDESGMYICNLFKAFNVLIYFKLGTVAIHDGHIHMQNPFFTMNFDKFAFNGVVREPSKNNQF